MVNKAPCRVILTAPPAARALDPMGPVPSDPPLPLGHALGVSDSDGSR